MSHTNESTRMRMPSALTVLTVLIGLMLCLPSAAVAQQATNSNGQGDANNQTAEADEEEGDREFWTDLGRTSRDVDEVPPDAMMRIDFEGTPLREVVNFFAQRWKLNFIIGQPLSGDVTIFSPRPVTRAEAWQAFLSALDSAGYNLVREGYTSGGRLIYRIVPNADAIRNPIDLLDPTDTLPISSRMVTRIVQVQNVTVSDIQSAISGLLGPAANVIAYAPSNTLILTDSSDNLRRVERIIQELDISAPTEELKIYQINFAVASELVEKIRELFGVQDAAATAAASRETRRSQERESRRERNRRNRRNRDRNSNSNNNAATPASNASGSTVGQESASISKLISDERTNSILVMATTAAHIKIAELIEQLDYEVDPITQSDIHVVYLEHADAEELASTLSNLTQEAERQAQERSRRGASARSRAQGGDEGSSAAAGENRGTAQFESGVRVTADAATNSLVITASRDDFIRLKRVIDRLDIRRKQVFVETVIMEISDSNGTDVGVDWHGGATGSSDTAPTIFGARGSNSLGGILSALGDGLAMGLLSQAIPLNLPDLTGGTTTVEIPAIGVVMQALQSDTNSSVLSAPSIITLDNQEATIEVGETIPFPGGLNLGGLGGLAGSAASSAGFSLPSVSVTREDVGIILRITPRISESDYVTLKVYQEISEAQASASSELGPTTTKRSAETTINVRDNQTVVIGGLMQTTETVSESKVPILGDIPLLGFFFRQRTRDVRKTNLLIFLTPHIIDEPDDLEEVYRIKMLQAQEFRRRFLGRTSLEQVEELEGLLRYSMNLPDIESMYRPDEAAPYRENEEVAVTGPAAADTPYSFRPLPEDGDFDGEIMITPEGELAIEEEWEEGYEEGFDEGYEEALEELDELPEELEAEEGDTTEQARSAGSNQPPSSDQERVLLNGEEDAVPVVDRTLEEGEADDEDNEGESEETP